MKLAAIQQRPIVGNIDANLNLIRQAMALAKEQGAMGVVTPELFLLGYPPRDLVSHPDTMGAITQALMQLQDLTKEWGVDCWVGAPALSSGRRLFNSLYLFSQGQQVHRWDKQLLPFYDVFDDPRYFVSGSPTTVIQHRGMRWGVLICEDAWADMYPDDYTMNPITQIQEQSPDMVLIPTASPFEVDKTTRRFGVLSRLAKRVSCPVLMVNQVGGQDDVVYAGSTMLLNAHGDLCMQCPDFWDGVRVIDLAATGSSIPLVTSHPIQQQLDAIKMSIRDYVNSNGAGSVLVGVSGGIDSAVTLVLAADALGPERVHAVFMPSGITSSESARDAFDLAHRLGVQYTDISIQPMLDEAIRGLPSPMEGVPIENLQARIRGCLLMTLANRDGGLVLTTGNKSEYAMGYCTLYGDMVGAFAPLKDVYKTQVMAMAQYLNQQDSRIPTYTIERPPTAELREGQVDQDVLPPYDILDAILVKLIDERLGISQLIQDGVSPELASWVYDRLHRYEYKRFQSPHGVKLSRTAFGGGRRMPITGVMPA